MNTRALITSRDMLDMLQNYNLDKGLPATDYQVHKLLGMTTAGISLVRHGKNTFGDAVVVKIAELTGHDPAYLLACVQVERAQKAKHEGVAKVWTKTALMLAQASVFAMVFVPELRHVCILC